jgi:hypothetical protein
VTRLRSGAGAIRVAAAVPLLALCVLSFGGCERPADPPGGSASRDPAPRQPVPRESDQALLRAIEAPQDRARAVEAELMEAKRRNDAAIEDQGG